nr:MAG TPA: hypothetical protein [Caudoviricetes sp.]
MRRSIKLNIIKRHHSTSNYIIYWRSKCHIIRRFHDILNCI